MRVNLRFGAVLRPIERARGRILTDERLANCAALKREQWLRDGGENWGCSIGTADAVLDRLGGSVDAEREIAQFIGYDRDRRERPDAE